MKLSRDFRIAILIAVAIAVAFWLAETALLASYRFANYHTTATGGDLR